MLERSKGDKGARSQSQSAHPEYSKSKMASKLKLECIISEGSKEGKADEVMSDIYAEYVLEENKDFT